MTARNFNAEEIGNFNLMKRTIYLIIILFCISANTGCEQGIFGPNTGTISGRVTNTLGTEISQVRITITYQEPGLEVDETREKKVSTTTDETGYYEFREIPLLEGQIRAEKQGLEAAELYVFLSQNTTSQIVDFQLSGYPEMTSYFTSKDTLYIDSLNTAKTDTIITFDSVNFVYDTTFSYTPDVIMRDSITFRLTFEDIYFENDRSEPEAFVLLYRSNENQLEKIISLEEMARSATFFQFEATLFSEDIEEGSYTYHFQFTDQDGNISDYETEKSITVRYLLPE